MFKQVFLPILLVMAFIVLTGLMYQGKFNSFLTKAIPTNSSSPTKTIVVGDKEINVEIAKTDKDRATGLSNRTELNENNGMIFVFPKDSKPTFWMKDTKIALDIIWINDDKIVGINENVKPEIGASDNKLKKYPAPSAVDYVLEVNSGWSSKNNIKVGTSVQKLSDL